MTAEDEQATSLEALEAREAAKRDAVEKAAHERTKRISLARENVDESKDDSLEEQQERELARAVLADTKDPSPFKAVRGDNIHVLRANFLVHGSSHMLALRSNTPEDGGRTLLHSAAFWGSANCVDFLLEVGADVNAIDSTVSRVTPLLEAGRAGHPRICKKLIEEGARVDCQDMHGDSIFHWCARRGRGSMIRHLLRAAEKVKPGSTRDVLELRNNRGRSAIDVAANETVTALISQEKENAEKLKSLANMKLRKGLAKARVVGEKVENAQQVKMQRRRYKRVP
ncbi:Ankyrin repeat domain-containing protein 1 [Hondaea fermentalgiana]|uniref:Ankyrin repeat domain-containing protein 1 n=1 Tax=Hondaea fermentalgiana TaxID=2315210 RepID=A0A2R5H0I9_9STRA|nr:Ankyrin repeat domain-containing protein 1 [Hondaea fermentalgiana]|eukprot:GBG34281.1 Ankyrin repeat domain-containing protein 1 [Hondaea fermentalgiana]